MAWYVSTEKRKKNNEKNLRKGVERKIIKKWNFRYLTNGLMACLMNGGITVNDIVKVEQ